MPLLVVLGIQIHLFNLGLNHLSTNQLGFSQIREQLQRSCDVVRDCLIEFGPEDGVNSTAGVGTCVRVSRVCLEGDGTTILVVFDLQEHFAPHIMSSALIDLV